MGNVFFIVWRESLEAVLVVGILLSFVSKTASASQARRAVWAGVPAGLALSLILGLITMRVQDALSGRALDLFQASTFLVSAALMTQMVFWMNRHGRAMKANLETGLTRAMTRSGLWGAAIVAMLAVAREGSETVVYLYSLLLENHAGAGFYGAAGLGIALALATAWFTARGIKLLNISVFFKVTSAVLLLSAAGLVVSGTAKLIEMDLLPSLKNPLWNTAWLLDGSSAIGRFVSAFTGYRARPSAMVALAYAAYWLLTGFWMKRETVMKKKHYLFAAFVVVIAVSMGCISKHTQPDAAAEPGAQAGDSKQQKDDGGSGEFKPNGCTGAQLLPRLPRPALPAAALVPSARDGVREYWISVESECWNVAPHPDEMSGKQIPADQATYPALRYHAYTPGFAQRIPENRTLGIAGPVIEATVGEQVLVHFVNWDSYYRLPHSVHVHGLQYDDVMDGSYMATDPQKPGAAVQFGETFTYAYKAQGDSIGVWPYHDHSIDATRNLTLGMYGAVRVRAQDEARPDAEFYLFMTGLDDEFTGLGRDYDVFNGLAYMGNTPHLMVKQGSTVRFNVIGFGSEFHTFHIHGYRWLNSDGQPEDVHQIGPAVSWHATIKADNPGMWMYHCHVEEHMKNGMMGMFMVE
ncbi:MAG: FTR1 family protein [Bdellovibrionota bacterium]